MDIRAVRILTGKELREAQRNRWFALFSLVFAGLATALSLLGLAGLGRLGLSGFGRTAASLLQLVMLLVPLMGLLLGALTLAGEREHGTLATLLAQPVSAAEVFAAKALGALIALGAAVVIGFGLSGAVLAAAGGAGQAGGFAALAAYALLLGAVHVGIGMLISALAARSALAVGWALCAWLAVVFFSDLGMMGTAIMLKLSPAALLWASLANPLQAFKLAAIRSLQGTIDVLGPSGRYASDVLGVWLEPVMAGFLSLWGLGSLLLAARVFQRNGAL